MNSQARHKPNVKGSEAVKLVLRACSLCLMLLPLLLITSLTGAASASSTSETVRELVSFDSVVAADPNNSPRRRLWRADISVVKDQSDDKSSDRLRQMIEQVRAVTFEPPSWAVEAGAAPVEASSAKPDKVESNAKVAKQARSQEPKHKLPYEPITAETLQTLRDLSEHPEKVDSPFELAETLFFSGNLAEAGVFYGEALGRTEPNDATSSRDRAWMLFQLGNCLRKSDLPAAVEVYAQLLSEYPDSPWAEIARAQAQLIDWYIKDEPRKLIPKVEETGGK